MATILSQVNRLTSNETESTAARRKSTRGSGHLSYRKPCSGILLERKLQKIEEMKNIGSDFK